MMLYKTQDKSKIISLIGLFIMSSLILISGIGFSIYSLICNTQFSVLGSQIPGYVFGIVVTFLGARYFASVLRLKSELASTGSGFSWSNFKMGKKKA